METSGGVLGKDASDSVYATVHQVCQRVGMREWKDEGPFKVLDLVVTEMFFNEPARDNRNVSATGIVGGAEPVERSSPVEGNAREGIQGVGGRQDDHGVRFGCQRTQVANETPWVLEVFDDFDGTDCPDGLIRID
jgi:hypothetical protein